MWVTALLRTSGLGKNSQSYRVLVIAQWKQHPKAEPRGTESEKSDYSRKYQSAEHQCFCLELSLQIRTAALSGELCARSSLVFATQQSQDVSASLAVISCKSLLGSQSSM